MDILLILIRFWGLYLTISCGAMLFNRALRNELFALKDNRGMMLISGFLALLLGAIHIAVWNEWTPGVGLFITLLGWMSLLKGALRLLPRKAADETTRFFEKNRVLLEAIMAVFFLLGLWLLWLGFAPPMGT